MWTNLPIGKSRPNWHAKSGKLIQLTFTSNSHSERQSETTSYSCTSDGNAVRKTHLTENGSSGVHSMWFWWEDVWRKIIVVLMGCLNIYMEASRGPHWSPCCICDELPWDSSLSDPKRIEHYRHPAISGDFFCKENLSYDELCTFQRRRLIGLPLAESLDIKLLGWPK